MVGCSTAFVQQFTHSAQEAGSLDSNVADHSDEDIVKSWVFGVVAATWTILTVGATWQVSAAEDATEYQYGSITALLGGDYSAKTSVAKVSENGDLWPGCGRGYR